MVEPSPSRSAEARAGSSRWSPRAGAVVTDESSTGAVVHGGAVAVAVGHAVAAHVREPVALVILDQLVVGHAALVERRALLLQLRVRALLLGLLLGDARLLLGHLGLPLALGRLLAMLAGDRLATTLQLALRLLLLRLGLHARHEHEHPTSSSAITTMAMINPVDM